MVERPKSILLIRRLAGVHWKMMMSASFGYSRNTQEYQRCMKPLSTRRPAHTLATVGITVEKREDSQLVK